LSFRSYESQYSVVGIVTRLWAQWFGVQFTAGARNISFLPNMQTCCGSYPAPNSVIMGILSLGVKWLGYKADCKSPSSGKFENK